MWTTQKLRRSFLDYFASKSHKVVDSSSVVPHNDDSLLFTNSGMVQFKRNLLGERNDLDRACSVQRCVRAGGKHNDLDDVGKDTYHHTYFEMLGNWSFGDYFKEDAIGFAWEFLVDVVGLDKERLYVTYYEELDKESFEIWKKYLPRERIISASYRDNFWEMGETGPCGPCTEIHYDRVGDRDASGLVNQDDPDVIEIWNIVFIEYNRRMDGGLEPLERTCIDTGVGLERLLSILMNVRSNYLIDSFSTIIHAIEDNCEFVYEDRMDMTDVAFRVVADHCRTIAVCIYDKVEFSSEGIGYVLRRILRRAVRYGHEILGLKVGVLGRLVDIAAKTIGIELESTECVGREEALFMNTLKRGIERFKKISRECGRITGKDLFLLYDTYGFPVDLTELMARERNIEVDYEGFESCKKRAVEVSRPPRERPLDFGSDVCSRFPSTDDSFKYERNCVEGKLQFGVEGGRIVTDVSEIPEDVEVGVVFDRTCFYAECGGQVGDSGEIVFKDRDVDVGRFRVSDTQMVKGFVMHKGVLNGKASLTAVLVYDEDQRRKTMRNHSGVHLLNFFLRTVIDTEQRGSLVETEKFRLDFRGSKLSSSDIEEVEKRVNDFIGSGVDVRAVVVDREEALRRPGLIHMKDEEYPEKVRIITMKGNGQSIEELCGGTHVSNVSDIGKLRIISESGVSANTRRIVGITGTRAEEMEAEAMSYLEKLSLGEVVSVDKTVPLSYKQKIEALNRENKKKGEELNRARYNKSKGELLGLISEMEQGDVKPSGRLVYYYEPVGVNVKKDISNSVSLLCKEAMKKGAQCMIYTHVGDEYLISATTCNNEKLVLELSSEYPRCHVRISKDMVQGIIVGSEVSKDVLEEMMNGLER